MNRTEKRAAAHRRRLAHAAVRTALARAGAPALDDSELDAVLAGARTTAARVFHELADYLSEHPDGLVSGDPRCPLGLVRLTHVLHDAGHTSVVRPGCARCGKLTTDLPGSGPDGRLCQTCTIKTRLSTCARCGRTRAGAQRK